MAATDSMVVTVGLKFGATLPKGQVVRATRATEVLEDGKTRPAVFVELAIFGEGVQHPLFISPITADQGGRK